MTLNEAIGIKYEMRDVKTGEEVSISERCRRAIEFLGGLDEVAKLIPFPVETLREKLKEDPLLNNTSMSAWDKAAGFKCGTGANSWRQEYRCLLERGGIWELYEKHGVMAASCADGVCLLKEAARMLVERGAAGQTKLGCLRAAQNCFLSACIQQSKSTLDIFLEKENLI